MPSPTAPRSRTALVTGAARGIGLACARGLVDRGHRVAFVDVDAPALQAATAGLPADRVMALACDIGDFAAVSRLESGIGETWEPVSILVNNAGISPKHNGKSPDILEISLEEWRLVLEINLTAAMMLCKQFLPFMRTQRWGRIVNISSQSARTSALVAGPSYMASKAGLIVLARHIATVFGKEGITANSVAPGRIVTPMSATTGVAMSAKYNERNPTGREGTVDEVSSAVLYLVSEEAAYCNGTVMDVNGGAYMS